MPDIGVTAVRSALLEDLKGLVAAVGVEVQDTVGRECRVGAAEVPAQAPALLEDPVTEVHGEHEVHGGKAHRQDVAFDQCDPARRAARQGGDVVPSSPGQDRGVPVHADGGATPAPAHPFTGHLRRAAEVLAQAPRAPPAELAEGLVYEIDLGLGALHRSLVQGMAVR